MSSPAVPCRGATLDARHAVRSSRTPSCGTQPAHISLTARRHRHACRTSVETDQKRRRPEAIRTAPHPALLTGNPYISGVLLPLVLVGLLGRVVIDIPWPDIDWPDLPAIPWPDITWPSIQWPDWQLPAWLRWVLDHAKYIVPVVVASVLAKREVGRRRNHDARRTGAPASRQGVDPEQPEHEQDRPEETGPQRP